MRNKNITKSTIIIGIFFLFSFIQLNAQPGNQNDTNNLEDTQEDASDSPADNNDTGNLEGDDSPPGAPIDDYLIPLFVTGVILSYRFIKQKQLNC